MLFRSVGGGPGCVSARAFGSPPGPSPRCPCSVEKLAQRPNFLRRLRVVPPGRDVAAAPGPPPGDLRRGRRAAFLCVANWVERKGLRDLLDAFARLPPDAATLHLAGDDRADPRYAARLRARLARAKEPLASSRKSATTSHRRFARLIRRFRRERRQLSIDCWPNLLSTVIRRLRKITYGR